jgi:hypothetical protein
VKLMAPVPEDSIYVAPVEILKSRFVLSPAPT